MMFLHLNSNVIKGKHGKTAKKHIAMNQLNNCEVGNSFHTLVLQALQIFFCSAMRPGCEFTSAGNSPEALQ